MHQLPAAIAHGETLLEEKLRRYPNVSEVGWVFIDPSGVYPGPDASRQFRVASMTKSFTAATVLAVALEHELSLDVPLHVFLPEIYPSLPSATVHDALAMTTGLPTDDAWADRLEAMSRQSFAELVSQTLIVNQAPGITYEYSNLGYAIIGLVIERITGRSFEELLHKHVLDPFKLEDSGLVRSSTSVQGMHPNLDGTFKPVEPTGPGAFSPIGGLWSTPADIGYWMFILRSARYRYMLGRELTSGESVVESIQNPRSFYDLQPQGKSAKLYAYGYGLHYRWDTKIGEFLGHSGGYPGFGSHMRWHTQTGLGIAVMGNQTYFAAEEIAAPILEEIVRTVGYQPSEPREKAAVTAVFEEPEPTVERNLAGFLGLIEQWDENRATAIFSANVFQDHSESELRDRLDNFKGQELSLDTWLSRTEVILKTRDPHSRVQILFTPLGEIQKFTCYGNVT